VDKAGWDALVGKVLVVDTDSSFVYLGTLKSVDDLFVVMTDVDAHDRRESPSTKEQYVIDTKRYGVKANRREISIRKDKVVSVSKIDDVVSY
jgi:small nuclear ribonucleoprotein (snRNP)-like protein